MQRVNSRLVSSASSRRAVLFLVRTVRILLAWAFSPTLDHGSFTAWRTQSLSLLINLLDTDHVYVTGFDEETARGAHKDAVRGGTGILMAVSEDLEDGYLTDVRNLVSAEVFSDFLEMARHLIDRKYKDAAASLCGAVLEQSLRRIADNRGVRVRKGDNLSALNQKLADVQVYTRITQRQLAAWTEIRNKAVHGQFDQYSQLDVENMHKDISLFLAQHLPAT